ncbi:hypothetical protein ABC733_17195 [Mangrovibacter sp. SLW1]
MSFAKLQSVLDSFNKKHEKFRYEIFQDYGDASFYVVTYAQQEINTEQYGTCSVWVEINGYKRLNSTNAAEAEAEVKGTLV